MIYNTVTFLMTNKCNMACAHCCSECCPENDEILDDVTLEKTIKELAVNPRIKTIAISGGEPFLFHDKVKKIVEWANYAGKSSAVYTNGFWCSDYDIAYNTLKELQQYGLSLLLTSVDTYHQKKVPIGNIKHLLEACYELGILTKLHVSTTYKNAQENDNIISSLGLSKLNASITTSAVFRAGRANETIDSCEIIVEQPIERFRCKYDGMCAVDWNGDVFWCCSVRNKNMILGNVKEDNINIILNKVRSNKLFLSIIKNAPFIIGRIRDRDLIKVEKKYADYCELCNEIFSDKSIVLRLEEEINSKLGKE